MSDGSLSEETKLIWLGLKQANEDRSLVAREVELLKEHVGDFEDYQSGVDESDTFEEHEDFITGEGFPEEKAETFTSKIQNNYDEWDDYRGFVDGVNTYEGLKNGFGSASSFTGGSDTEDGEPAAGVRIHDEPGTSYNGVSLPAGTVEIFGNRVEFSSQDEPDDTSPDIVYSNLQASETEPTRGQTITVSADVENEGDGSGTTYPRLLEDGAVYESGDPLTLDPSESDTVEFEWASAEFERVDLSIGGLDPITVRVIHEGIT